MYGGESGAGTPSSGAPDSGSVGGQIILINPFRTPNPGEISEAIFFPLFLLDLCFIYLQDSQ